MSVSLGIRSLDEWVEDVLFCQNAKPSEAVFLPVADRGSQGPLPSANEKFRGLFFSLLPQGLKWSKMSHGRVKTRKVRGATT